MQAVVSTSKAVKMLQNKLGLEETGVLDPPTIDAMKQPRCGVPDVRNYQTFAGDLKWGRNDVTYRWDINYDTKHTNTFFKWCIYMIYLKLQ